MTEEPGQSSPGKRVRGQCYCTAVCFEVVPTGRATHCHCEDCRATHSAAFVTWISVLRADLRWISGEEDVKRYESHPGIFWGFCSRCGSSMFYESSAEPDLIDVTVASLVDPLDRGPEAHMSFEERVPWLDADGLLPRYVGKSNTLIERQPVAGSLDHVELYVSDLNRSTEFWGWLLERLGFARFQKWARGVSWKKGDTYLVFVQAEAKHLDPLYHRKRVGLNHLAFHGGSMADVEALRIELRTRGVAILYEERAASHGADARVFFEDPDRIKVEVVGICDHDRGRDCSSANANGAGD